MSAPFSIPIRVYYRDTDAGGVVYHANYLAFMEAARMELLEAIGVDVVRMAESGEAIFMVYSIDIQYHKPARLNDLLTVTARSVHLGRVRMQFEQHVRRGDEELVTANVHAVCVNPRTLKPIAVPAGVREKLEHYR